MKNALTALLLVASGALIFFSVESRPGGLAAGNPTTHVVDSLEYVADLVPSAK